MAELPQTRVCPECRGRAVLCWNEDLDEIGGWPFWLCDECGLFFDGSDED